MHRHKEKMRLTRLQRTGVILLGFVLMLPALSALARGGLFYLDYRELLVFAPFMLLIGLLMIFVAVRAEKRD